MTYDYVAECPIDNFRNFGKTHRLDELKDICKNSKSVSIYIEYENYSAKPIGYIENIEFIFSEKLCGYCLRFSCKFNKDIYPKAFSVRLISGKLVLVINEKDI